MPRRATNGTARAAAVLMALVPILLVAQASSRSTWNGVYSAEQAERGASVYAVACAQCHGPDMSGIDAAPPLVGGRFAANWNGVTLGDMVERIRISMPQNDPGSMGRAQVVAVTAYLLQQNGFPAGAKDLPRQSGILGTIVYEAYAPDAAGR